MQKNILDRDFKKLSVKQQIGLYVVLTKLFDKNNRPFYSSEFAKEMAPFLLIEDPVEYRKIIGGILGALSKNNMLIKVSSDRDPIWQLPEDIHTNTKHYRNELNHIPQLVARWHE